MKWISVLGITILIVIFTFYEWPKMNQKKEKAAFLTLTIFGWMLSIVLIFFPNIPGPTQLIAYLFKPFGKIHG
ncbi:hypothetical protein J9303_09345 [Bacillaceae bacterium Marseille-Q3522]|nr:hypothetical protein [Bacillaceae bacterium Marseille-Q3522]